MRLPLIATLAAALAGCASTDPSNVRLQQPPLAADQAAAWTPENRLYRSLTLDYVSGADVDAYRPLIEQGLNRAGLLAPTPAAARYGLRVSFTDMKGGESVASYRVVHRASGQIIFAREIAASFHPVYGAMGGERIKLWGDSTGPDLPKTRRGVLDTTGFVSGPRQSTNQMMGQTITRFVIALGESEGVRLSAVVPCLDNAEVLEMKGSLTAAGVAWRSDDCLAYRQARGDSGLRFTGAPGVSAGAEFR